MAVDIFDVTMSAEDAKAAYDNAAPFNEFALFSGITGQSSLSYLYDFDGTTTTVSGVQYLVDSGTAGVNAGLSTGQGLKPQATASIDTGIMINTTTPRTISWCFEIDGIHGGAGDLMGVNDGTNIYLFGLSSATEFDYNIGGAGGKIPHTLVAGDNACVIISCDGLGNYHIDVNGGDYVVEILGGTTYVTSYPFKLGAYSVNGSPLPLLSQYSACKDFYDIPVQLTPEDRAAHVANPENSFYWEAVDEATATTELQHQIWLDNGNYIVRSDLASITPAVIADMQAGNGFWYSLSENAGARSTGTAYAMNNVKYRTFSTLNGTVVVGAINDTFYTNAANIDAGVQKIMYETDATGTIGALADINIQATDDADLVTQVAALGYVANLSGAPTDTITITET